MSSLPVLMISMTICGIEMACDPADGAQKGDRAEANADMAVAHAPEFCVRPARGEVVQCFGRNKEIAHAFEDQRVFEV